MSSARSFLLLRGHQVCLGFMLAALLVTSGPLQFWLALAAAVLLAFMLGVWVMALLLSKERLALWERVREVERVNREIVSRARERSKDG